MSNKLCLRVCNYYFREAQAVVAALGRPEIVVEARPPCGKPAGPDLASTAKPAAADYEVVQLLRCGLDSAQAVDGCETRTAAPCLRHCLQLVVSPAYLEHLWRQSAYVLTPGWLEAWPARLTGWGFDQATARAFFAETTRRLVLLDTGLSLTSAEQLAALGDYLDLPVEIVPVGLDHLQLHLQQTVAAWERKHSDERVANALAASHRRLADYGLALDLLGDLAEVLNEAQVVERILHIVEILLAPGRSQYATAAQTPPASPGAEVGLVQWLALVADEPACVEAGDGLRVRFSHHGQTLGGLEVGALAFPQYRPHYQDMLNGLAPLCGLALANARAYEQLAAAEAQIREYAATLEQQVADRTDQLTQTNAQLRQEIKDRQRAEAAVRASEERFRTLAETAPVGIFRIDTLDRYHYVNNRWCQITGLSMDKVLGLDWTRALTDDERDTLAREWALARQEQRLFKADFCFRRADGATVWAYGRLIPEKKAGALIGYIGVFVDITDRKQMESALQDSEERWRSWVENVPARVTVLDEAGVIQFTNRMSSGRTPAEAVGTRFGEDLTPEAQACAQAALAEVFNTGQTVRFETALVRANGDPLYFDNTLGPLRRAGKIVAALGSSLDITERKLSERALSEAQAQLAQRVRELETLASQLDGLAKLSGWLQLANSSEEVFAYLAEFGPLIFIEEAGAVLMREPGDVKLAVKATWNQPIQKAGAAWPVGCLALGPGAPTPLLGTLEGPCCLKFDVVPGRACLCAPINLDGQDLGVLHLQLHPSQVAARQPLALAVAEHLGLALANIALRDKLRQQVIHDPLTGLFNRHYLADTLERELRRAARQCRPVSVLIMDLDHFKSFNDSFGHPVGDLLLQKLAHLLQSLTRTSDIACRYGGEEFMVILPETSVEVARDRAEAIRVQVAELSVEAYGQPTRAVTLSVGVAGWPLHGATSEALIRAADQALYQAKARGRNQVVCA